jgi:hypothetical protein
MVYTTHKHHDFGDGLWHWVYHRVYIYTSIRQISRNYKVIAICRMVLVNSPAPIVGEIWNCFKSSSGTNWNAMHWFGTKYASMLSMKWLSKMRFECLFHSFPSTSGERDRFCQIGGSQPVSSRDIHNCSICRTWKTCTNLQRELWGSIDLSLRYSERDVVDSVKEPGHIWRN